MKRWPIIVLALSVSPLGSCLADFDRTVWDFTEGPITFHLDASQLAPPAPLQDLSSGQCRVAAVGCTQDTCVAAEAACNAEDMCAPRPSVTLSEEVSLDDAHARDDVRIDSVDLEELSAVLTGTDLDVAVEPIVVSWAPAEAPESESSMLAVLPAVDPHSAAGGLEPEMDGGGVAGLQDHLTRDDRFRLFVGFTAELSPGAPCPAGGMDMELSLRFRLTGEQRAL
jgi:hypothetical protein